MEPTTIEKFKVVSVSEGKEFNTYQFQPLDEAGDVVSITFVRKAKSKAPAYKVDEIVTAEFNPAK